MRSIEQMYAEGDYAAIRQMLDEAEAKAEAKAKEERAKKILLAREELVAAMKKYIAAYGGEMSDREVESFKRGLMNMEVMPTRRASILTGLPDLFDLGIELPPASRPSVKNNTDADVLRKFLSREM